MKKPRKLILFDIDGTLIRPLMPTRAFSRFAHAAHEVYGVNVGVDDARRKSYMGMGDRGILWDMVKGSGISHEQFIRRLPKVTEIFIEFLDTLASEGPVYEALDDAKRLVKKASRASHITPAILTGNLEGSAIWKLDHAGYTSFHAFGVYGHEADHRDDLARLAVGKAQNHMGTTINPHDVVVIGDTLFDLRCARAIGAFCIIVTTGWNVDKAPIEAENPDLLVDSLMDKRVLAYLNFS